MQTATALILALALSGCAFSSQKADIAAERQCLAGGGEWIPIEIQHPGLKLEDHSRSLHICRLPTTDAGMVCTGPREPCQGECLAPRGAKLGQEVATGICSAHQMEPDGTLVIWGGHVHDGYPILY
jgi:hypothetical protein